MYLFTKRHCETVKQLFDVPSGKRPGVPGVITCTRTKSFPDLEGLHHRMSVLTKLSKKTNIFWYAASDQSWPLKSAGNCLKNTPT